MISDVGGLDCDETCSVTFEVNTEVVFTAVYDNGLAPIWVGCLQGIYERTANRDVIVRPCYGRNGCQ